MPTWVANAALPALQADLEAPRGATCLVLKAILWYEAGDGQLSLAAAGTVRGFWQSAIRTRATVRDAILIFRLSVNE